MMVSGVIALVNSQAGRETFLITLEAAARRIRGPKSPSPPINSLRSESPTRLITPEQYTAADGKNHLVAEMTSCCCCAMARKLR